ncbi:MAG: RNA-binding domain-containing protein [Phycisphaerales bacterium]
MARTMGLHKPVKNLNAEDFFALVAARTEEGQTLDFKLTLPGNSDQEKHEFRADVTALANTYGGDLVYGIRDEDSVAVEVVGLQLASIDEEVRRIEEMLRSGIEPSIRGDELQHIPIPGKGHVLVVRVPRSWAAPHLVKSNSSFRVYGRGVKRKYPMDAGQIRSAFSFATDLPERIRDWHRRRVERVAAGETPVALEAGAKLILHLVPVSSFMGPESLSANELSSRREALQPFSGSWSTRINVDGLLSSLIISSEKDPHGAYCQVFRSGRVELVFARLVHTHESQRMIASVSYEMRLIDAVTNMLRAFGELRVPPPIFVAMSVRGALGARMGVNPRQAMYFNGHPIDRDELDLPDALFERLDDGVPTVLRPVFDALWNACGWERCLNYDNSGKWSSR